MAVHAPTPILGLVQDCAALVGNAIRNMGISISVRAKSRSKSGPKKPNIAQSSCDQVSLIAPHPRQKIASIIVHSASSIFGY